MDNFNDLPVEVLGNIIDLSIEEYVLLDEESSRRKILVSLALVSKMFTLPSQRALWKYIGIDGNTKPCFKNLVETGFAKDMVVERLTCNVERNTIVAVIDLFVFVLKGLKSVKGLSLQCHNIVEDNMLPLLFHLPSLKLLQVLDISILRINVEEIAPSSTFAHLKWRSWDGASFKLFFNLLRKSSIKLRSLALMDHRLMNKEIDYLSTLLLYFRECGSSMESLKIPWMDPEFSRSVLALHTPALQSLYLSFHPTWNTLNFASKSVSSISKLETLIFGSGMLDSIQIDKQFRHIFINLLKIPQLQHLTLIRFERVDIEQHRYGRDRKGLVESGQWCLETVEILDECMELCRKRNIRLTFSSEEDQIKDKVRESIRIYEEKKKQLGKLQN